MRRQGLPQSILIEGRVQPPRDSWWLSQGTREEFKKAHEKEIARLTRCNLTVPGQDRIVGRVNNSR